MTLLWLLVWLLSGQPDVVLFPDPADFGFWLLIAVAIDLALGT